jgi:hypothetical protein
MYQVIFNFFVLIKDVNILEGRKLIKVGMLSVFITTLGGSKNNNNLHGGFVIDGSFYERYRWVFQGKMLKITYIVIGFVSS